MTYEDAWEWFEEYYDLDWATMDESELRAIIKGAFRDKWSEELEEGMLDVWVREYGYGEVPSPDELAALVEETRAHEPVVIAEPADTISGPFKELIAPTIEPREVGGVERAFASVGHALDRAVSSIGRAFGRLFGRD